MSDFFSAVKKAVSVFKTELQSDVDAPVDTTSATSDDITSKPKASQDDNNSALAASSANQVDNAALSVNRISSSGDNPTTTDTIDKSPSDLIMDTNSATSVDQNEPTDVVDDSAAANNPPASNDDVNKSDESIVRHSSFVKTDKWKIAALSLRGRAHISDGSECQDFHSIEALDSDSKWVINVVSDGAGSAKQSARGSNANCKLACQMFKLLVDEQKWVENNYFPTDKEWYIECHAIFSTIKSVIANKAIESKVEPREFNATILVLLTTPRGILVAHIGDGRMGYQTNDNQWHSAINPHKGEEANQTVFIPNQWNAISIPAFKMSNIYLPETHVIETGEMKSYVIMSDGCEHAMWICHQYDKEENKYVDVNKPGERFLTPLVADLKELDGDELVDRMKFIMRQGTSVCLREKDDQTLVVGLMR